MDYILFLIYKVFKFLVLITPKFLMKFILDIFVWLLYFFNIEHKRYAKANLDLVYEDKIYESRKKQIIKNAYENLVYNLYEFIENSTLNLEQLEKKVRVTNEEVILKALENDRKIILISAHYGNWEYITSYISLKYKATTMVGRPANNKYFNEDMKNFRNAHNSEMLEKNGSASGLLRALKKGRIIGLAIDQHVPSNKGLVVDFLGHKANQTDSTARMALKTEAVIIPVFFEKESFRKYNIKFCDVIDAKEYKEINDNVQILAQMQADVMADQILEKPDDWFWHHKRFKQFYKEIYEK